MLTQTFNILFVIFYILHFSKFILIPNEIRYFMMISFLILNIYGLLKRKLYIFNRKSLDDDLFIMDTNPKKPKPSDPEMVKFMSDLNKSIEKKKLDKIKVKNE
jgi:hypothetical protein|nr:MAG TPA: hypothetical protein [Inoviridae sp.]